MTEIASVTGEKLHWTEKAALLTLAGMLVYSVYVWITQPVIEIAPIVETPEFSLKGILLNGSGAQHLFTALNDTAGNILRKNVKSENEMQMLRDSKLVDPTKVLSRSASGAGILDVKKNFNIPLNGTDDALLLTTNKTGNRYYATLLQNGYYLFSIRCRECVDAITFAMTETGTAIHPQRPILMERTIPSQRVILLSKYETTASILDHTLSSHLLVANLIERHARTLAVPGFSATQIHYSPLYIDNRTLLFSVTDTSKWGTYLYHILEDRYEKFSDSFTDRAFFSVTGKLVLVRTYYNDRTMNVPFGSYALYARKMGINRAAVDRITGSGARAVNIRKALFENPDGSPLRFKLSLTYNNFSAVQNNIMRNALLALWQEYRYPKEMPEGSLLLFRGTGKEDMEVTGSVVPFQVNAKDRYFEYTENIGPLLRALEVPTPLIAEYEVNRAEAEAQGQNYELVDLWWD